MIRVSVVVPTYRRPEQLERCLSALVAQDFDHAMFEILIADDAGCAETRRQVEEIAASCRPAIRYLPVTGRHGPAAARIVRAGDAVVVHPVRPAPWGISLRQQRKSLFDALLYKKHPRLYRLSIGSQPPWNYYAVVALLVLAAAAARFGHSRTSLAAICG